MKTFQTTFLMAMLLMLCSCADKEQTRILDEVQSYISEAPEQALETLDSLSAAGDIRGREENARFALLYSMALDKNGIDSVDDSLINVAVKWYSRHGNADERMKSYYYYGRICQNAGNNEAAMESFVKAEQYVGKADDHVAAGLLYIAMSNISMDIFDTEKVLEYSLAAESCFKEAGDKNRYAHSLMNTSIYYSIKEKYEDVSSVLDTVRILWDYLDIENRKAYFHILLGLYSDTGKYTELQKTLDQYISYFSAEDIDWLNVSSFYLALGDTARAEEAIRNYENNNEDYRDDLKYYLYASNLYDTLRHSDTAYSLYKRYSEISDSLDLVIFSQNTKSIRSTYEKELMIEKSKYSKTVIALVSFIVIILLIIIICQILKILKTREAEKIVVEQKNETLSEEKRILEEEVNEYKKNYSILMKERDALSNMIENNPPVDRLSMKIISDRLKLLNDFFAAAIVDDDKTDSHTRQKLYKLVEDKKTFMSTTRLAFSAVHPRFINYLESKGLSEWQIEFCCLFTLGLSGKEVGQYIQNKRHYIESFKIRQNLGLSEHDTNLGIYLRKLLSEDE